MTISGTGCRGCEGRLVVVLGGGGAGFVLLRVSVVCLVPGSTDTRWGCVACFSGAFAFGYTMW